MYEISFYEVIIVLAILVRGIESLYPPEMVCQTKECINWGKYLNERMNYTQHACNDFYEYTCGRYADTPYPPALTPFDKLNLDLQNFTASFFDGMLKLKDDKGIFKITEHLYERCVHLENEAAFLEELIKEFCWEFVDASCTHHPPNLELFYKKSRNRGFFANDYFTVLVKRDERDTTKYFVYLDRPGMQSDEFGPIYDQISLHTAPIPITDAFLLEVGKRFGGDKNTLHKRIQNLRQYHQKIVDAWRHYNPESAYHLVRLSDMRWYSHREIELHWTKIINAIISPANVSDEDYIVITCPKCIKEITDILTQSENTYIIEYAILGHVLDSLNYATPVLRKQFITSPTEFCQCTLAKWFDKVLDYAYVTTHDKSAFLKLITNMFSKLRKYMAKLMIKNLFLPFDVRYSARDKVDAIRLYLSHHASLSYKEIVKYVTTEMELREDTHLMPAICSIRKAYFKRMYKSLNDAGRTDKYFNAATLNIHYDRQENAVYIPAAALHDYFISPNLPQAVNYALMGSILGHEIAHAFDSQGVNYNAVGNWNTKVPFEKLQAIKQAHACFWTQYGNYFDPETTNQVDELKTLNENIADTGGAYIAYNTLKGLGDKSRKWRIVEGLNKGFSEMQLFWISYASRFCSKYRKAKMLEAERHDNHPSNRFRVNGAVSNIKDFSADFLCTVCTEMNRVGSCNFYDIPVY